MPENPFQPSQANFVHEPPPLKIFWKQVLIGFGIGVLGSLIFGVLWGILAAILAFTFDDKGMALYESPIAYILGWGVGIAPFLIGLIYTCSQAEHSRVINCLVVAVLSISSSVPFMFLDEDPFDWTVVVYHLVQLALAMIVGMAWPRNKSV